MIRILIFGDDYGIPMAIKYIPRENILGFVVASIRPQHFDLINNIVNQPSIPILIQPRKTTPLYPQFVEDIKNLAPTIILVNSYSMLISEEILAIPQEGGINIHGGLLPQYRGANPIQWAMLNNEIETGVTMHKMTAEFDRGDIIAQKKVPIHFADTWKDVQKRIVLATESLLDDEIPKILSGKINSVAQDESKAGRYYRRHPEDGLIDWNKSVLYIYNLIRALVSPHPGAFYYIDQQKILLDNYHTLPQVIRLKYSPKIGKHTLYAQHLCLFPLCEEELPSVLEWVDDREQTLSKPSAPVAHSQQYHDWFQEIMKQNDFMIFGIRFHKEKDPLGICQLQKMNFIDKTAEISIRIGDFPEFNNSCMSEVIHLMSDFCFEELGLACVNMHLITSDTLDHKFLEDNGFQYKSIQKQVDQINNEKTDILKISILKSDYEKK